MSRKNSYGVGIMGAGVISKQYLTFAPLFADFEVRGVADLIPERAATRSREHGVPQLTPEALLADPSIDVVVSLTQPQQHFGVLMSALEAGKHAYTEKPFALSREQGELLKRKADEKGLRVGSAPDTFLGGAHQQVRQLIDAGRIGQVTSGTAIVMSKGMENWHPDPFFFFQPGGGPILDVGPYYVADFVQLIGPVKRVTAFGSITRKERPITSDTSPSFGKTIHVTTPTTIHAALEFENGAVITLIGSWEVYGHGHAPIELYGTGGTLYVPDPNFFGGDITVGDREGQKAMIDPWDHPLGVPNEDRPNRPQANYRSAGIADFVRAIDEGRPARCGVDFVLHVSDVLTSILRSIESGRAETIETTCERPAPLLPEEARSMLRTA
ncbi:MAG: Gfo/Idh/MocA family protein [Devosia sp.]